MASTGITEISITSLELLDAGDYVIDRGQYVMKGANGEIIEQGK